MPQDASLVVVEPGHAAIGEDAGRASRIRLTKLPYRLRGQLQLSVEASVHDSLDYHPPAVGVKDREGQHWLAPVGGHGAEHRHV